MQRGVLANMKFVAIGFHVFGAVIVLIALCLELTAILTHNWQTFVTADSGKFQSHSHGLWMDCIEETIFVSDSKTKTCFFKFHQMDSEAGDIDDYEYNRNNYNNEGVRDRLERLNAEQRDRMKKLLEKKLGNVRQHKVLTMNSRKAVLGLLVFACVLGLVGLFFSYCAPFMVWAGFVWSAVCFLATIFSLAGVIVFFVNTHDFDNLYTAGSTRTSLTHGYSFYCCIAATALFFLATIVAGLTAGLYLSLPKSERNRTVGPGGEPPNNVRPNWINRHHVPGLVQLHTSKIQKQLDAQHEQQKLEALGVGEPMENVYTQEYNDPDTRV